MGPPAVLQIQHYHGPALKPKHLSMFERWRGYGECRGGALPACSPSPAVCNSSCLRHPIRGAATHLLLTSSRHGFGLLAVPRQVRTTTLRRMLSSASSRRCTRRRCTADGQLSGRCGARLIA